MEWPSLSTVLAVLVVIVAAPLAWIVAFMLWELSRADRLRTNRVIRAQAWAAVGLAVIVTVFAVVFVNNEQAIPPLDPDQTRILTRGVLLLVSVASSVYWIRLYRTRKS